MSCVPKKYRLIFDLIAVNSELRVKDDNEYNSKKNHQQEIKYDTKRTL